MTPLQTMRFLRESEADLWQRRAATPPEKVALALAYEGMLQGIKHARFFLLRYRHDPARAIAVLIQASHDKVRGKAERVALRKTAQFLAKGEH